MAVVNWCFDSVLGVTRLTDETDCEGLYVQFVRRFQSMSTMLDNI